MNQTITNNVEIVIDQLIKLLADKVHLPFNEIDINIPLIEYGVDSVDAVSFVADLGKTYNIAIEPTAIWDHQTINKISIYILELLQAKVTIEKPSLLYKDKKNLEKKSFPLIDKHRYSKDNHYIFVKLLSRNHFYIKDHVINKKAIFPGAAYIEMACQAVKIVNNSQISSLHDVIWTQPIILNENDTLIKLSLNSNDGTFEIESKDYQEKQIINGKGRVSNHQTKNTPNIPALKEIEKRCTNFIEYTSFYNNYKKIGFEYGDSFRSIEWIKYTRNEALVKLTLNKDLINDSKNYTLHPSLLDGAFQSVIVLLQNNDDNSKTIFLPFAIKELIVWQPIRTDCFIYIQASSIDYESKNNLHKFNMIIFDKDHTVLAYVKDFCIKKQ